MKVVFLPEAEDDIEKARTWYEAQSSGLEMRFAAALHDVLVLVAQYPFAFQKSHNSGARHVSLPGFPYLVYYLSEDGLMTILGILHVKRNPDIFRRR